MAVSNIKASFPCDVQMETVMAKKVFMKPFVKAYLKKQQKLYVSDLKKALL